MPGMFMFVSVCTICITLYVQHMWNTFVCPLYYFFAHMFFSCHVCFFINVHIYACVCSIANPWRTSGLNRQKTSSISDTMYSKWNHIFAPTQKESVYLPHIQIYTGERSKKKEKTRMKNWSSFQTAILNWMVRILIEKYSFMMRDGLEQILFCFASFYMNLYFSIGKCTFQLHKE